ncbi:MAG: DUF47 domain-containing protein [Desulfurococcaceae archaeon]
MSEQPESTSLVELTVTEHMVNICRVIKDELVNLITLFRLQGSQDDYKKLYEKIREIKNRGEEMKILLMEYLVKSSEIMMYSRSYIEIVRSLERIIQHIDGVAYRYLLIVESRIIIGQDTIDKLLNMIDMIMKQLDAVESSIDKIRISPRKALETLDHVIKIEEDVDNMFRRNIFEIYSKYSGYITALMILKDLVEYIEEISDIMRIVGEELRYLALVKTSSL